MRTNNLKYTSIDSVLYDISLMIPEGQWDETRMREWAIKALRKFELPDKYHIKVALLQITEHKVELPEDARYVESLFFKQDIPSSALDDLKDVMNLKSESTNPSLKYIQDVNSLPTNAFQTYFKEHNSMGWALMRRTNNSFLPTITTSYSIFPQNTISFCEQEYTIDIEGCITTTAKDGYILLSYLAFTEDDQGNSLIPDNETLKEAIFHYCMYRFWMSRSTIKEQGSIQERNFHLKQFELLKRKAIAQINMPDEDQMESIKNFTNRLVPRSYRKAGAFSQLGTKENINF